MAFPSLQSGVIYDSKTPTIQRGTESIYGALGQIVGRKIMDEEKKQAIYQDLLNVGLDEVKGKYQDEAAGMKADLLKRTAQMFADTEGLPSAQQLKEITAGKNKLTNYATMYKGMQDWYLNASMQAAQIPSPKYREKTIANITDIMSSPTLSDTWDAILTKPWLELPPPTIDIYKIRENILKNADQVNRPFEPFNRDKYGNISYEAWQDKDPNQVVSGAEWAWENTEGLKETFPDVQSWVEFIGNGREYQNKIIKPNAGRGSQKKTPQINFNYATQQYEWADINNGKGLPLAEFTNLAGENVPLVDATITMARPDPNTPNDLSPKQAKIVSPSLKTISLDDLTKGMDQDQKADLIKNLTILNPGLLVGKSMKDALHLTELWVPFDLVKSYTDRNLNIVIPEPTKGSSNNTNPAGI